MILNTWAKTILNIPVCVLKQPFSFWCRRGVYPVIVNLALPFYATAKWLGIMWATHCKTIITSTDSTTLCNIGSITHTALQWRYKKPNSVSNHRHLDCLLNPLFRHTSKKTSKLRVAGLCDGKPPVTSGFPSHRARNAENASIWWRHHR